MSSVPLFLTKLKEFVITQPNKIAWTFLNDHGIPIDTFTYLELDKATSALADYFLKSSINPGDRVLLVFFPGLHFMISLLACFKVILPNY